MALESSLKAETFMFSSDVNCIYLLIGLVLAYVLVVQLLCTNMNFMMSMFKILNYFVVLPWVIPTVAPA